MFYWFIVEMRQRQDERLREAESIRIASEAARVEYSAGFMDRALLSLGQRLTTWGRRLEENHAPLQVRPYSDQAESYDYIQQLLAPVVPQSPAQMVALDQCGAAHKHMNVYSHSHRG